MKHLIPLIAALLLATSSMAFADDMNREAGDDGMMEGETRHDDAMMKDKPMDMMDENGKTMTSGAAEDDHGMETGMKKDTMKKDAMDKSDGMK